MATAESILRLFAAGWSQRRIARELHVSRDAVAHYVRLAQGSPAKPVPPTSGPTGSETLLLLGNCGQPPDSKPAPGAPGPTGLVAGSLPVAVQESLHRPSGRGRRSDCEPYRDIIQAMLGQGLSAQRIYQDLVADHGFPAKYWSVRRFVQELTGGTALPFRRMECEPGEEAQVDFGAGAWVITPDQPAGAARKKRKTHVFRIVLSHSRKAYSEATYRQTTEDFLRALENAFAHFGGVPKTLVIDNLKAAVAHPDWFDPEITPKVQAFCRHYGTVILPTRPYMPRHKGKVESGVKYVKNNALAARTFASAEEENRFLLDWETTVADTRIHGTTKRHVARLFQEVERPALLPLPLERFACFHESRRKVNRDGHVEVAKAYYSAPPEYLGHLVWVRWDARVVRIFNHRFEQIALHLRREPGRFSTLGEHLHPRKISGLERGARYLLKKVRRIGPQCRRWAQAMLSARGIEGTRVLQGLLSLAHKHDDKALEKACQTALSHGAYRLRTLRKLLQRPSSTAQEVLPFLHEHPIIRPLRDYARGVARVLQTQADRPSVGEGFRRHDWTEKPAAGCAAEKRPGVHACEHQGLVADVSPPRSGYPSPGCASAEPDSVSPNVSIVVPSSSSHQEP
jgi:transposase